MTRESGDTAPAVADTPMRRTRNGDPQQPPWQQLHRNPEAVRAARRLAESITGSADAIAAIILILTTPREAEK